MDEMKKIIAGVTIVNVKFENGWHKGKVICLFRNDEGEFEMKVSFEDGTFCVKNHNEFCVVASGKKEKRVEADTFTDYFDKIDVKQNVNSILGERAERLKKQRKNQKALVLDGENAATTSVFTCNNIGFRANNMYITNDKFNSAQKIYSMFKGKDEKPHVYYQGLDSFVEMTEQKFDTFYLDFCSVFRKVRNCIENVFTKKILADEAMFAFSVCTRDCKGGAAKTEKEMANIIGLFAKKNGYKIVKIFGVLRGKKNIRVHSFLVHAAGKGILGRTCQRVAEVLQSKINCRCLRSTKRKWQSKKTVSRPRILSTEPRKKRIRKSRDVFVTYNSRS